jgi:hypothetical protein
MASIEAFVAIAQDVINVHHQEHFADSRIQPDTLSIDPKGRKFARIVAARHGETQPSRVHCFVNKENGDVLKAAGWKSPAKHARGNINDSDGGRSAMTPYGAKYL